MNSTQIALAVVTFAVAVLSCVTWIEIVWHRKQLGVHSENLEQLRDAINGSNRIINDHSDSLVTVGNWIKSVDADLYATPSKEVTP